MPHYRTDLPESGDPIDVIEYQAQHPDKVLPPDPRILKDLMRRDLWARGEALLILAGFPPDSEVENVAGVPWVFGRRFGAGAGCIYLDGTTDAQLSRAGIQHPLKDDLQGNYRALRGYSQGQPLDETKPPQEWLAWAESKGFVPYWLDYWREHLGEDIGAPQGETTIGGDDLLGFETVQEHQWNGGAIDYERWTEKSDTLTAAQAARLMSGLDPELFADLALVRNDAAGPAKQRALRFEQLAAANDPPKEREAPIGWLIWADKKHEKVHSPFRAYVFATQYQRQENEKRADGRYTLEEAAQTIAENTGERAQHLQEKLMQAVADGVLPVYRPGEWAQYKPKIVRGFYEEAYWEDLNAWLENNEPRISWRFPKPVEAMIGAPKSEPSEQRRNGEKIRRVLDAEIELAKKRATDPSDYHSVWSELKKIALDENGPFTGNIGDMGCLLYTDGNQELKGFTKDALRKRMSRSAR